MDMFEEFKATALYCPTCRQANPVRERLLLVLPEGDMYEYKCAVCGTSVGTKKEKQGINQIKEKIKKRQQAMQGEQNAFPLKKIIV